MAQSVCGSTKCDSSRIDGGCVRGDVGRVLDLKASLSIQTENIWVWLVGERRSTDRMRKEGGSTEERDELED